MDVWKQFFATLEYFDMNIKRSLLAALVAGGSMLAAAGGLIMATAADAATDAAAAQPPAPHEGHGWGPGRLYSKLGLTEEQQASIKSIWTAAKPQMKTLHDQEKANHLKLLQTSPDDPNYASVVAEVAQTNASLASQRTTQASAVRAQIHALLTPAQKAQLKTLEAEWAASPHQAWGHRHGGPGGGPNAAPPPPAAE
jgi:Spy/CpxP family protein refolding chaperone